jgi:subtilase family serine protease
MTVLLLAVLVLAGGVSVFAQERAQDNGNRDAIAAPDAGINRPGRVELAARVGDNDIYIPGSSIEDAADVAVRAHTNHVIVMPEAAAPKVTMPSGYSPAQLWTAYGVANSSGGNVRGAKTIVIVDAYDYPTAAADLTAFSSMFGLPLPTATSFQVVYGGASKPAADCGWAQEEALDIEWAHAMAPNANIVLVEAASSSFGDLFAAVDKAGKILNPTGAPNLSVGQVSMSWGGSEFSSETSYDSHFLTPGVVYFASSGDTGGVTIYPSVSPNVVSAGGTSLTLYTNGARKTETGWSGSGGGPSQYEKIPSYQSVIQSIVGSKRGVPDFSFDADPNTGVAVYDSTKCQGMSGWMVFGGTSVASPSLAGIVNAAGSGNTSSTAELKMIYGNIAGNTINSSNFYDVVSGTAGKYKAASGWDFVTGIGSNIGVNGK